jgi:hypothetical protein
MEEPHLRFQPKFQISPTEPVFAMGSCFAREIEEALSKLGFDVPSLCDALFKHPLLSKAENQARELRPRGFLNRYNTLSMEAEFRNLLGQDDALSRGDLLYTINARQCADLHYSQSLPQVSHEATLTRRAMVRDNLGAALRRCKLIIITLGLAECWFDSETERYLNNTPGPRVLERFGSQLQVHLTRHSQNLAALERLHKKLCEVLGADIKLVLTVSPVPLVQSFLDQDVVIANQYAKSMLRSVAQEFASNHTNVDYFPSYEFVSYALPQSAWEWDYRHVRPALVRYIMNVFRTHYVREGNNVSGA